MNKTPIAIALERQIPEYIRGEYELFVKFVKAYYEWLEEQDNPIYLSRRVLELRDIDTTIDSFLSHFQQKYLWQRLLRYLILVHLFVLHAYLGVKIK